MQKFPDAEVSSDVLHHLAYSYDALWSLSLAEMNQNSDNKNPPNLINAEHARLKAIELFKKYLKKYSHKQDELKNLNDRYEFFKLERKMNTHADYRPHGPC
ncbi:MAG: hypothetical protein A2Y62_03640 [Candidatus Fischerbacteria bacterium RBG_13_37_8]|uniref:Uncharacterized protein n=1 Tax=Candidatus Fischerbacteria bacterium RBG_13_37_8 TaxID=1817863 RepID=A0A1F5V7Y8_9BACT|nr:MAG: hypothetical protein A2Y62_03640 [Candidatus Fischerbacteria bacterium RBG_13_37_8]